METKAEYLARILESMAKREESMNHGDMLPMQKPENILREAAKTLIELSQKLEKPQKERELQARADRKLIK